MNILDIEAQPRPELTGKLQAFERQFSYPLGATARFTIDHGSDYPRFFRAMGPAACFVAEQAGEVVATLCASRRTLLMGGKPRTALYIGDLKVAPGISRGRTLLRLAAAAADWAKGSVEAAYAVVMEGTNATPEGYTGRLGIPRFEKLGAITVLSIDASTAASAPRLTRTSASEVAKLRLALAPGRITPVGGSPSLRSRIEPAWFTLDQGRACGLLEDTRAAKCLRREDGREILAAHLTHFAYRDAAACVDMLAGALSHCRGLGFESMFSIVDADMVAEVQARLKGTLAASATVYGVGLPAGEAWSVNSSEI